MVYAIRDFLSANGVLKSLQMAIDEAQATMALKIYSAATGKGDLRGAIATAKDVQTQMRGSYYSGENVDYVNNAIAELNEAVEYFKTTIPESALLTLADIDFENRECVVFGKGGKERPAYFDARTKIHLKNYLGTRSDDNPALFVSLAAPHERLKISGVEIRLRRLGRRLGINRVHPHKFRRTMATRAIDKGMPVEQVQRLLGHSKIDTTMQYALVNQSNVKNSHKRFIA